MENWLILSTSYLNVLRLRLKKLVEINFEPFKITQKKFLRALRKFSLEQTQKLKKIFLGVDL